MAVLTFNLTGIQIIHLDIWRSQQVFQGTATLRNVPDQCIEFHYCGDSNVVNKHGIWTKQTEVQDVRFKR